MGVYDRIEANTGEFPQEIEPDFWLRDGVYWSSVIECNDTVDFTYEVDNRRFSGSSYDLEVSLWHNEEKLANFLTEEISTGSFKR